MEEPKDTQVEEKSQDEQQDEILDNYERGKEAQEDSSTSEETTDEPTEAGADQQKKAEPEEKSEGAKKDDPRDLAFRKGYNEAKTKYGLAEEDKSLLAEMKKISSSPEYISTKMKSEGYTQEAIDSKLRELGHSVPERPGDDVGLVASKLGLDLKSLDENTRATIGDVSKIARVIIQDAISKTLPTTIKPLADSIEQITQKTEGDKLVQTMEKTIKDEGVLDFKKDVEPELNKWLDANPNATQQDLLDQFKELSRTLTIERLKTGKRKEDRDAKKSKLRENTSSAPISPVLKREEGEDMDDYQDRILDNIGYRE